MTIPTARVTIDGREIEVPAGTGLVEAAAKLDIEIPVFCYEPRIGPAVGACRMCLVEIEGMPKLQTACSTSVRDGMVVSSASGRARDAQEAVLEFLLINHPLDCPVCDKGGECPLQDHAFRWGPGASRFLEVKRNDDKPIPISPLIALDRERCILCYRCTRFSSEVAGDNQLITRERGNASVIATFEGRPYEGHFSGNVIELCPVGALTSTEYRFKARPWEAPDHPTVCNLCPVGCNTYATVREGRVARVIARQNDAVDEGWLCDRGRFWYPSLYSEGRVAAPYVRLHRDRPPGNRPTSVLSMEGATEWLYQHLLEDRAALEAAARREAEHQAAVEAAEAAGEPAPERGDGDSRFAGTTFVLSGGETLEEAYAVQQVAAATGGRVVAAAGASAAAPTPGATIGDLAAARHILVLGDADLAETAPILDLRVRKALRAGASVTVAGIGGTRLEPAGAAHEFVAPGTLDQWVTDYVSRMRTQIGDGELTEPGIVIYRDGDLLQSSLDQLADLFQLQRDGSGFLAVPRAANARGLAALGIEPAAPDVLDVAGGLVFLNVDADHAWPEEHWRLAVKRAGWAVAVSLHETTLTSICDLVMPATGGVEKEGTTVNLEGRLQRLAPAGSPPEGTRTELAWLSGIARRLGAKVPAHASGAYRMLAAAVAGQLPASHYSEIPLDGVLGVTGTVQTQPLPSPVEGAAADGELMLYVAPFLYDGYEVANATKMHYLHDTAWLTVAREDARVRGLERGSEVVVAVAGRRVHAKVAVSRRIAPGHARIFAGAGAPHDKLPAHMAGYHACTVEPARQPEEARA